MQRDFQKKTLTANFKDTFINFEFNANEMIIIATTANAEISFDGDEVHGEISPADGPIQLRNVHASRIWLRGALSSVRIFAWV